MIRFYINQIKNNNMTIDNVPAAWREKVKTAMTE